jgi:hypothetical protein
VLLDELVEFVAELIGALIGTAQLVRPLLIFDCQTVSRGRIVQAFVTFAVVKLQAGASVGSQVLAEFKALGGTSEHVVEVAIRVKATNYLVLGGHVQFFHYTVKFLSQLDIFAVEASDLTVFLRK